MFVLNSGFRSEAANLREKETISPTNSIIAITETSEYAGLGRGCYCIRSAADARAWWVYFYEQVHI